MTRRPDWRAVVLRRAHARAVAVRERQTYVDMGRIQMTVGGFYLKHLADAAALRDMTVTAYCRRAIAAFVAADMDVRLNDLLADTPHPEGQTRGSFDPGTGHGEWVASRFGNDTSVI